MAEPVETISNVARQLILFESRFQGTEPERKKQASRLFKSIASLVQEVQSNLATDQPPVAPCRQLNLLSTRIVNIAGAVIGHSQGEKLSAALAWACDPERLVRQVQNARDRDKLFGELDKAHILIRALAEGIFLEEVGP